MLAFESAVHETCRADVGRWKVTRAPHSDMNGLLRITRDGHGSWPDTDIATVAATSDLRLAANDEGFEDETGRANANLLADAPALLLALAQLLDACYLRGTPHKNKDSVFVTALNRARQLLESHASVQHAVQWWIHAQLSSAEEVEARIEQLHNGEQ